MCVVEVPMPFTQRGTSGVRGRIPTTTAENTHVTRCSLLSIHSRRCRSSLGEGHARAQRARSGRQGLISFLASKHQDQPSKVVMEAVSVVQVLHQVCSLGSKVKQQNETLKSGLELLRDQRVSLQEKLGSGELAPSELLHKCLLKLKDAIEAIKEFQKANVIEQAFKRKSLLRCLKDCEARVTDILATQRFINAESTINRWQGMYNILDGLAEDIHTLALTKQVDTRFPEGIVRAGVFM